jgi:hypothetical protein
MHCTVNCWILGEHGDREWVGNGREGVNLIKAWYVYIHRPEVQRQNPLRLWIYTSFKIKKKERWEGKVDFKRSHHEKINVWNNAYVK